MYTVRAYRRWATCPLVRAGRVDFYYPTTHTHTHTPICNGAIYTWGWIKGGQQIFTRCCGCWHLLPDLLLLTAKPTFFAQSDQTLFFSFSLWNGIEKVERRAHRSECRPVTPTVLRTFTCQRRIKKKLGNQNFRLFDITEEEEEKQNSQRTLKSLEKTKLKSFLPFFPFTVTRHTVIINSNLFVS